MAGRIVTIDLPDDLYERLEQRARATHQSVAAEVVQLLAAAVPADDDPLPSGLRDQLIQVESMDDPSLWRLARTPFPARTAKRMQTLQFKRQREGLNQKERELEVTLAQEYDRHMLIRSKVLVLLKQRGHEVTELVSRR